MTIPPKSPYGFGDDDPLQDPAFQEILRILTQQTQKRHFSHGAKSTGGRRERFSGAERRRKQFERMFARETYRKTWQGFQVFVPPIDHKLVQAFRVLGIEPGSCRDTVKTAYRSLARLNHPDRGGDTRKMQEINDAYDLVVKSMGKP